MTEENHSNYLKNKGSDNFSKTGYSNSRLSGNFLVLLQS
ncbi:Replication initiation protein [Staphylococcus aureus]